MSARLSADLRAIRDRNAAALDRLILLTERSAVMLTVSQHNLACAHATLAAARELQARLIDQHAQIRADFRSAAANDSEAAGDN